MSESIQPERSIPATQFREDKQPVTLIGTIAGDNQESGVLVIDKVDAGNIEGGLQQQTQQEASLDVVLQEIDSLDIRIAEAQARVQELRYSTKKDLLELGELVRGL